MNIRTDLVTERRELHTETLEGAFRETVEKDGVCTEKITIQTHEAAQKLGKPVGQYITLSFENLQTLVCLEPLEEAIVNALQTLLPEHRESVMVVGLGNREITPDALGPLTVDRLLITRHIGREFSEQFGLPPLQAVSSLAPNVIGKTGMETLEIISGVVERAHPSALLVLDALAARRPERLCRTLQLSNTGLSPGSGVQNSGKEISQKTLGIPVIALGIPTVVDVASLVYDLTGKEDAPSADMMVTPKDIDQLMDRCAALLSGAINRFLQPELDRETLRYLA